MSRSPHIPDPATATPPAAAPGTHPIPLSLATVLVRPDAQRVQEFKYRFGQSVVFGLPVVALQWFGRSLGGAESDRWVSLFQALLAGWVVYTGATGMLAEGMLRVFAGERPPLSILADSVVAGVAAMAYLLSLPHLVAALAGRPAGWPHAFHWCVLLSATWTALRWERTSRTLEKQA